MSSYAYDEAEEIVLVGLYELNYREVTGEAFTAMTSAVCNFLDGLIGKTTFIRKIKRYRRKLDVDLLSGKPMLTISHVEEGLS